MPARMTPADLIRAGITPPPTPKSKGNRVKQSERYAGIEWHKQGIPTPTAEHRFCERKWAFDFAWPDRKIALEIEGGVWSGGRHTRGAGFVSDMAKYNRATVLGWRVIRCTPQQINSGEIFETLRAILGDKR